MRYGYDPDGLEKILDVTKTQSVGITGVMIRFPAASAMVISGEPGDDLDASQANVPGKSADVQTVATHVAKSIADRQTILVGQLRCVIAITAFIALLWYSSRAQHSAAALTQ